AREHFPAIGASAAHRLILEVLRATDPGVYIGNRMNRVCFEQVLEWNIALDRMSSRERQCCVAGEGMASSSPIFAKGTSSASESVDI
ncbi:hypothetical protein, partial [Rhizobium johnstonii]|uniref:hypothetical protein n=1 Tax=Rhizobium johnstonii TaxID=3019933 RepID=UPI003F953D4E